MVSRFHSRLLPFTLGIALLPCMPVNVLAAPGTVSTNRLPTGERLSPHGSETAVGSFPANMVLSPDGRFVVVTDTGFRQHLTVISTATGKVVSVLGSDYPGKPKADRLNLYYGLAFAPKADAEGNYTLYVSFGSKDGIGVYHLTPEGSLKFGGTILNDPAAPKAPPVFPAGVAVSRSGRRIFVANNETTNAKGFPSSLAIIQTGGTQAVERVTTPGFPYAVAAITRGAQAGDKVYVSSERDGVVSDVYVGSKGPAHLVRNIHTGDHPVALLLNSAQTRLYVANASSDTVSVIDTATDHVLQTLSFRGKSGLPGVTPTGLALNGDETRLYVTLADKNALAVAAVHPDGLKLLGELPTGWYPTSVVSAAGHLYVANAKGVQTANPDGTKLGPAGQRGRYIENILQGTVERMPAPASAELPGLTKEVAYNDRARAGAPLPKTTIKHVIYIIKENRTYDQVLGDMPEGNGDPALCMFGEKVTPNQHALARRFVLLDNYYCSAEVSTDGWYWCTQGMASEYVERNVPYNYSGRGRFYDFGGVVNGVPVSRKKLPDVTAAPGGYLWDDAARAGISYRNYGFFEQSGNYINKRTGQIVLADNQPDEPGLVGHTDINFRRLTFNFADSDAWKKDNCKAPTQQPEYGKYHEDSRVTEWLREFRIFVKNHNLPALEMVRFMRDHTIGTKPGYASPVAMVADNDYAVGRLVQAVSKSPYWKSTAIFVVEDDAQNGYDHVDCHRSTAYVISPCIVEGSIDHHYYNTDSILHTIEALLHLKPMCRYDADAPIIQDFTSLPFNNAPYAAMLPAKSIIDQLNTSRSYGASISAAMDFKHADQNNPTVLNEIIWHSVEGSKSTVPPVKHSLTFTQRK